MGYVVSLRHSSVTTPASALMQFVCETAHPLLVPPPGVVALTPLALANHLIIINLGVLCVVWCIRAVCGVGLWPNAVMREGFHRAH